MRKRKFLMKMLAATVAATMAVTPLTAYADDGDGEEAKVYVDATEEDKTDVEIGDITADGKDEAAILIVAQNGHEADVSTGSLTSNDGIGADTWIEDGSVGWLDVNGDVKSEGTGVWADAMGDSYAGILVGGDIDAGNDGVHAKAGYYWYEEGSDTDESTSFVQVTGDVEAVKSGIWTEAYGDGKAGVDVRGNVIGGDKEGAIYAEA